MREERKKKEEFGFMKEGRFDVRYLLIGEKRKVVLIYENYR